MPRCVDYNSGDNQMGVGYFQRLLHRSYRHSAARVFLHLARATGPMRPASTMFPPAPPIPRSCCRCRAVGPARPLGDLGAPVAADLPVGESFRDHYSTRVVATIEVCPDDERT